MRPLDWCKYSKAAMACSASLYGYLIGAPLLLAAGTVGNAWTSLVVVRWRQRRAFTASLILTHAVLDTLVLWTGLSRHFYMSLTGVDVRETSEILCKLQRFLLYVTMDASSTFLVAVTADRFGAVWYPHGRRRKRSLARTGVVVPSLIAASVLFNLHVLITRGEQVTVDHATNRTVLQTCGYLRPEYEAFWVNYQGWLGMSYFCIVPFFAMAVLNLLTVARMRARRRLGRSRSNKNGQHLTGMLLAASMWFICVTAPAFLYNNIEAMIDHSELDEASQWRMRVADTYTSLLQYVNHAVNFYLYVLTGRGFRRDVRKSIRREVKKNHRLPTTSH